MQAEKEELADALQTDKIEALAHEKRKFSQKIDQLRHANADMKERLLDAKKTEDNLIQVSEELA